MLSSYCLEVIGWKGLARYAADIDVQSKITYRSIAWLTKSTNGVVIKKCFSAQPCASSCVHSGHTLSSPHFISTRLWWKWLISMLKLWCLVVESVCRRVFSCHASKMAGKSFERRYDVLYRIFGNRILNIANEQIVQMRILSLSAWSALNLAHNLSTWSWKELFCLHTFCGEIWW